MSMLHDTRTETSNKHKETQIQTILTINYALPQNHIR